MTMDTSAKDAIAVMRRSHDEMVGIVEGLTPDGLELQSASSEWTVADVLSHLGSAAEIGFNTLTTGRNDMAAATAIWDRWNAMSPGEKAANFVAAEQRLVAALEALDDEDLATMSLDVGFLPEPIDVAFFASMRLGEMGLHRWDIEVAFDQDATVASYLVPFPLRQLPLFAGFFAKATGQSGRVVIETTNPSGWYVLEVHEDGASLRQVSEVGEDSEDSEVREGVDESEGSEGSEGSDTDAATHLALAAESLLRLAAGRLDPDHTPAAVTVQGDLTLDDLRRLFPGY